MKKLYGFDNIKQNFIDNFINNKLHHCNIIAGTKGIGKMQFVLESASIILSEKNSKDISGYNIESTRKLIDSGGHTDLIILDMNTIDESGKENNSKKSEINIKQVRKVIDEVKLTPSISKNKVLIIDSIDNVNINGQNALLKTIEEPTKNTYIFLICHNTNKVISTILSRSNITFVSDLKIEDWSKAIECVLEDKNMEFDGDVEILYNISNHSISTAIKMIECRTLEQYNNIIKVICGDNNIYDIQKIADDFSSNDTFEIFTNLIEKIFENIIRFQITADDNIFGENTNNVQNFVKKSSLVSIIKRYENIRKYINDTNIYNLDKKQIIDIVLLNSIN